MSEDYYLNKLYPLQDRVLRLFENTKTDFYLTGGTALSRAYFHHRYSDDLDFFMNASSVFVHQTDLVIEQLQTAGFHLQKGVRSETFSRLFIAEDDVVLKIDLVNDVPFRKDKPRKTALFNNTDNVFNILSNKVSALTRDEPKDIADILIIAQNTKFNWRQIIADAQQKDAGVEEIAVTQTINEFDLTRLLQVNWCIPFEPTVVKQHCEVIAKDILFGRDNSLYLSAS